MHFLRKRESRVVGDAVSIVADGAVATHFLGEGRFLAVVIVDTTNRTDLEELMRVHQFLPPGDVISQWGEIEGGGGQIGLTLSFKKSVDATATILFDMPLHAALIDLIVRNRGFIYKPAVPVTVSQINLNVQK
jgi:hypothetical protein